jgi:ABC-type sugar transport system ATPase subunit
MSDQTAYRIRSLKHAYDGSVVVDIPGLDISEGEICILTGPNGSGKTTLLSILALLLAPAEGEVRLRGVPCVPCRDRRLRRLVTMVHQTPVLFSTSVRNNIAYGLKIRGLSAHDIRDRVRSAAEIMQLAPLLDKQARKLSGGEGQPVVLARALILDTPILLLDEPTNSLDAAYRPMLADLLKKANRERGATVIIATHDSQLIESLPGRIIGMENGRITDAGKSPETRRPVRDSLPFAGL